MKIASHIRIDRAAMLALGVIAADQLTKAWAFAALADGDNKNVFLGINFTKTRNEGIAFGFFAGRPMLVLALMAAALAVLMWFYARHRDRGALWLATGLLLGGAIGNAIDRIALGYVRDFIDTSLIPTFNLADVAITFGVIVLVLTAEQAQQDQTQQDQAETGSISDRQSDRPPA